MYKSYFNLRERPFELTCDTKYLFLTASQREALSTIEYGLSASKSMTVVVGEAGTGKTTLLRAALQSSRCASVRAVSLNNPTLTRDEFINSLARRFELSPEAGRSKAVLLDGLERALRERRARGEVSALIVDEAQRLSTELLEEVRLLANIETPTEKLLPLVLAGQPELAQRLEDPTLRQLKQRVVLRCSIAPFELAETASYIARRIKIAGGVPSRLFTQEAVKLIHQYSRGIARTVSVICDNALINAMALDRPHVDSAIVAEVCAGLCLTPDAAPVPQRTESTPIGEPIEPGEPPAPVEIEKAQRPEDESGDESTALDGSHARSYPRSVTESDTPLRRAAPGG
jgi:type II secretory pathway predicted ATPase ExeA